MSDTFSPHYTWLKTWRENASPPIIFYGTTAHHIPEIQQTGLVPFSEEESFFIEGVRDILTLARKTGDKRSTGFAEIILMEHLERPKPLELTFNYNLAVSQAGRKVRGIMALRWLSELFFEHLNRADISESLETEVKKLTENYEKLGDVRSDDRGVIIHVCTDLEKFDSLPTLIEDRKELHRTIKGKSPWCRHHGPEDGKWRKMSRQEIETCIETIIRGRKDFEGLGCRIITSETIPPSDIVKIEPVQL